MDRPTNLPSKISPATSLIALSERLLASRCSPSEAAKAAAQLFGCYRKGDANDPETYALAVAAVLSTYPVEVVREVCDPRTGIPGRLKWLPVVAEVKEACEAVMQTHRLRVRTAETERKMLAARTEPEERSPEEVARIDARLRDFHTTLARTAAGMTLPE
jgi:hypothetical protein